MGAARLHAKECQGQQDSGPRREEGTLSLRAPGETSAAEALILNFQPSEPGKDAFLLF